MCSVITWTAEPSLARRRTPGSSPASSSIGRVSRSSSSARSAACGVAPRSSRATWTSSQRCSRSVMPRSPASASATATSGSPRSRAHSGRRPRTSSSRRQPSIRARVVASRPSSASRSSGACRNHDASSARTSRSSSGAASAARRVRRCPTAVLSYTLPPRGCAAGTPARSSAATTRRAWALLRTRTAMSRGRGQRRPPAPSGSVAAPSAATTRSATSARTRGPTAGSSSSPWLLPRQASSWSGSHRTSSAVAGPAGSGGRAAATGTCSMPSPSRTPASSTLRAATSGGAARWLRPSARRVAASARAARYAATSAPRKR